MLLKFLHLFQLIKVLIICLGCTEKDDIAYAVAAFVGVFSLGKIAFQISGFWSKPNPSKDSSTEHATNVSNDEAVRTIKAKAFVASKSYC